MNYMKYYSSNIIVCMETNGKEKYKINSSHQTAATLPEVPKIGLRSNLKILAPFSHF